MNSLPYDVVNVAIKISGGLPAVGTSGGSLASTTFHWVSVSNMCWLFNHTGTVPRVRWRKTRRTYLIGNLSAGSASQTCILWSKRRELLRAVTLDDSTPQCRISELRVWSYEPFIVSASSLSGYTSSQNLEVLNIINTDTKTYKNIKNLKHDQETVRFTSRNWNNSWCISWNKKLDTVPY